MGQAIRGINRMTAQLNALRDQLTSVLEVDGIGVSQLVAKKQELEPAGKRTSRLDKATKKQKK